MKRGAGQIVAVIEPCDNPNVTSDQAAYRSEFGLPRGKFYKFNEYGEQSDYPPARKPLGAFIDVDVEMIAAVCPKCTMYLVEANNLDQVDMQTANATAATLGANVISNPWSCSYAGCVDESYFDTKGITYVGMAIDGVGFETYPADFDADVAAGGTYLSPGGGGKRGWTDKLYANSGGGCFSEIKKPSWQAGIACPGRVGNDVSMDFWNVVAYDSYDGPPYLWFNVGGNDIPTALVAGVFGLAGNANKQDGGRTFWEKSHQTDLYPVQCESSRLYGKRYSYSDGWGTPRGLGAF